MYFKYDIKMGFCKDWYKIFVLIGAVLISCIALLYYADFNDLELGSFDYLLYLTKAEPPYDPELDERFQFPFTWFLLHLYLAWLIGRYPFSELYNNHGSSVLILGGSRRKWYISKLIWALFTVVSYYLVMFLTVLIFCAVCQIPITWKIQGVYDPQVLSLIEPVSTQTLLAVLMLPILTSITVSALQLFLSALTSSVISFFLIAVLFVASTYETTVLLFPNCSQLSKYTIFSENGIGIAESYIALGIVLLGSVIAGLIHFQRQDILKKQ